MMLLKILIIVFAAIILYGLDRLFLWMEDKGWIYYRKKKASPKMAASALLEVHSILEPEKKIMLEEMRAKRPVQDEEGEGKNPGKKST